MINVLEKIVVDDCISARKSALDRGVIIEVVSPDFVETISRYHLLKIKYHFCFEVTDLEFQEMIYRISSNIGAQFS
jgi:hypothetical protein